jgi:cytochrome c oxidase assembly protein subunit 11
MKEVTHEQIPGHDRVPSSMTNKRAGKYLVALLVLVIGMTAFAYANAEWFVMICQRAGIISTPPEDLRGVAAAPGQEPGRPLDVYFAANVNDGLPIAFTVEKRFQKAHVGETAINYYRFTNLSDRTLYFRPVHDVNPIQAGQADVMLLTKCFCFDMQKIDPHQTYSLPVDYTFTDKLEDATRTIRMNYSLFPSTKAAYDEWVESSENAEDAASGSPVENAAKAVERQLEP